MKDSQPITIDALLELSYAAIIGRVDMMICIGMELDWDWIWIDHNDIDRSTRFLHAH